MDIHRKLSLILSPLPAHRILSASDRVLVSIAHVGFAPSMLRRVGLGVDDDVAVVVVHGEDESDWSGGEEVWRI